MKVTVELPEEAEGLSESTIMK